MKLTPKNWTDFQHYNKRTPPWIKLHRELLDNFDYQRLPIASKALAPMLWLIASEHENGEFDGSMEFLAFRLRWDVKDIEAGLKPLIDKGFFVVSSGALAERYQDATPETEGEGEVETEAKREVERVRHAPSALPKPDFLSKQVWNDYRSFRTSKRAKLTPTAWTKIQNELERGITHGHDPNDMLGEAMVAGWTGFKCEWYENRINGNSKRSDGSADGWSDVLQIITKSRGDQQAWLENNPEYRAAIQSIGGLKQLGMMNDFQLKDARQRFADALAERRAA